ncbi:MAG: DUF4412 domain-containing protein [Proteobacteria bacterium]|nr:DUF4412 domain-containing protein [Pseudomonadota bacterium]
MPRRLALSIAILGCAVSASAFADFRAEFVEVKGDSGHALTQIEVSGSHLRMDSGNVSMLVDAASGNILMLRRDKQQYLDLGKMAQSMNAMLANVPPQMREMMKQRMAAHGHGGVTVTYAPTGQTQTVDGYTCAVYSVNVGSDHGSDTCLADLSAAGIDAADQATVRKVFEDLRALAQTASAGMASSSLNQMPVGKFPVMMTRYDAGKVVGVTQIKQVTRGAIASADFAIPAGYSEMQMPGFGAGHH